MLTPFFIVGPTAIGKSEIALAVAEQCGAEIIGADAFQVYEGFDLLTAKPSAADRSRVSHHMIGCVPVSQTYNVARYHHDARRCIAEVAARGKRNIVVGGSGLYVKALTHGLSPLPPADPGLRAGLETHTLEDLLARLHALDPIAAGTIDAKNKRRLVRALEVCLLTGGRFSDFRTQWAQGNGTPRPGGVFLTLEKEELNTRIDRRIDLIFESGVLEEVRSAIGEDFSPTSERMIGLNDIRAHLLGAIDETECRDRLKLATRQYAKRQMTWFRGETIFEEIRLKANSNRKQIAAEILSRLSRY